MYEARFPAQVQHQGRQLCAEVERDRLVHAQAQAAKLQPLTLHGQCLGCAAGNVAKLEKSGALLRR